MKTYTNLQHKKVLVLGLAKSGFAAAELLQQLGAFVTVNDAKPFEENKEAQLLLEKGITVICGRHPEDLLDEGFELIVKNPGIPYTNPIVEDAMARNLPVWTEVELAYLVSEAPMVGITGSNGKTTTTTLVYEMLAQAHKKPLVAGNIGTVACGVAQQATSENIIVTELSSFQLMGVSQFKPKVAVLLNLYDAHLDYHGTFEAYAEAKFAVTKHQDSSDYFIYNADQAIVKRYAERSKAQLIPFTTKGRTAHGISADETKIYWQGDAIMERAQIALPGEHNLQNIVAAVATCLLLGCEVAPLQHVLQQFSGVKHRTQFVSNRQGVKWYNDSKATNCLATKSALLAFTAPTILLAGGLERHHSFDELGDALTNVKHVIAFGETKQRLQKFMQEKGIETTLTDDVTTAVHIANQLAVFGDTVLLSPACASWDQYESFELRGDAFINAVNAL